MGTRKDNLWAAGLCFHCLKSGHIAKGCSACCIHCQGRHHALLCNPMTSDPGVTSNVNVEQTQPKMPNKDAAKPSNQPVSSAAVTSHTVSFTGVSSATNNAMSPSGVIISGTYLHGVVLRGSVTFGRAQFFFVQDDQQPRLRWPLGVISQLFQGHDGVVKTVEVITVSGKLVRSIPRIHDLKILSANVDDVPGPMPSVYPPETAQRPKGQYMTSRGRVVKPVQRLDLYLIYRYIFHH